MKINDAIEQLSKEQFLDYISELDRSEALRFIRYSEERSHLLIALLCLQDVRSLFAICEKVGREEIEAALNAESDSLARDLLLNVSDKTQSNQIDQFLQRNYGEAVAKAIATPEGCYTSILDNICVRDHFDRIEQWGTFLPPQDFCVLLQRRHVASAKNMLELAQSKPDLMLAISAPIDAFKRQIRTKSIAALAVESRREPEVFNAHLSFAPEDYLAQEFEKDGHTLITNILLNYSKETFLLLASRLSKKAVATFLVEHKEIYLNSEYFPGKKIKNTAMLWDLALSEAHDVFIAARLSGIQIQPNANDESILKELKQGSKWDFMTAYVYGLCLVELTRKTDNAEFAMEAAHVFAWLYDKIAPYVDGDCFLSRYAQTALLNTGDFLLDRHYYATAIYCYRNAGHISKEIMLKLGDERAQVGRVDAATVRYLEHDISYYYRSDTGKERIIALDSNASSDPRFFSWFQQAIKAHMEYQTIDLPKQSNYYSAKIIRALEKAGAAGSLYAYEKLLHDLLHDSQTPPSSADLSKAIEYWNHMCELRMQALQFKMPNSLVHFQFFVDSLLNVDGFTKYKSLFMQYLKHPEVELRLKQKIAEVFSRHYLEDCSRGELQILANYSEAAQQAYDNTFVNRLTSCLSTMWSPPQRTPSEEGLEMNILNAPVDVPRPF